jgi:hypothetical protein
MANSWLKYSGFQPLHPDCKEIRVLHPEDEANPSNMRFVLKHAKLDELPTHCALSYSWGAPVAAELLQELSINAEIVRIRPTLFSCLQTLMSNSKVGKYLWIDAICINQHDLQERVQQVSMMGEIFEMAQSVYLWLGPGDDDTNYALEHIGSERPSTAFDTELFSMCLERLFEAAYWKRRWVIQEFALAQAVVIFCGRHVIECSRLVDKVSDRGFEMRQFLKRPVFDSFKQLRSPHMVNSKSLLELMERFHDARCVDPHDRAFAHLSIAKDGRELSPGYDKSVGDIYFEILSFFPTHRVLPPTLGYRWPSHAADRLQKCLRLSRENVLSSLVGTQHDRFYTAFEKVRKIQSVHDHEPCDMDDIGASITGNVTHEPDLFQLDVRLHGGGMYGSRGTYGVAVGDLIYSLQTTSRSPCGLSLAVRPGVNGLRIIDLIVRGSGFGTGRRWVDPNIDFDDLQYIRDMLLHHVVPCRQTSTTFPDRIFCHIDRLVLVGLWLMDIGQFDYLLPSLERNYGKSSPVTCDCTLQQCHSDGAGLQPQEDHDGSIEISPSFRFHGSEPMWSEAISPPWIEIDDEPLHECDKTSSHRKRNRRRQDDRDERNHLRAPIRRPHCHTLPSMVWFMLCGS